MEPQEKKKAALSFTGGKDCLLAMLEVHDKAVDVAVLVTFGPPEAFLEEEEEEEGEGVAGVEKLKKKKKKKTFLAHPLRVIKLQARALGLPHVVIPIEGPNYLESYADALRLLLSTHQVTHLVTGDILDVCEQFMQKAADKAGTILLRPLWERPRRELLALMMQPPSSSSSSPSSLPPSSSSPAFTFLLSCCSVEKMGRERGRAYVGMEGGRALERLMRLAVENEERRERRKRREGGTEGGEEEEVEEEKEVDACGEGGEYHSMVLDMPLFTHGRLVFNGIQEAPVLLSEDEKYLYCDLDSLVFVAKK